MVLTKLKFSQLNDFMKKYFSISLIHTVAMATTYSKPFEEQCIKIMENYASSRMSEKDRDTLKKVVMK